MTYPVSYPVGTGSLLPVIKRPKREAKPTSSSADVKNAWSYNFTPSHFMSLCINIEFIEGTPLVGLTFLQ